MKALVIDCGATTCRYNLLINKEIAGSYSSIGFTPVADSFDNFPLFDEINVDIDEVYFYGTAMIDFYLGQAQNLLQSRFNSATIHVHSDLLAAARSCCQENPGYIHIIGTGSAVTYWDGKELEAPKINLGYLWEDFASGYDISKTIIRYWCQNKLSEDENRVLEEHYGSKKSCLYQIYQSNQPKLLLAKASLLLRKLEEKTQKNIINERLEIYFTENVDICPEVVEHHFVGSLAYHMKSQINSKLLERGKSIGKIMSNTMEALCSYHNHKSN